MPRKPNPGHAPRSAAALDRAVRHVLRPLVRLLLAKGVPYPAFSAMLKDIYFDVATGDFALGGGQTNSQISLITGLHRKDVRSMRGVAPRPPSLSVETSIASEIFTRWISNRRYLDRDKRPRSLARLASAGGARSFESLAGSVSKDVRARALLDELLRLGLVSLDGQDRVTLNQKAFVPRRGSDEVLHYFGENAHDHLATAVCNLLGEEPRYLEQAIFAGDLSAESVEELAALVRRAWEQLVRDIVPRATALDARDTKQKRNVMRMRFGMYFHAAHKIEPARKPPKAAPTRKRKSKARKQPNPQGER
jgi:Family of unknown function (DUF6502)